MVNFKLGETNVKMKLSACHKRGTKKESDRVPDRIPTYDLPIQTPGGRSIHLAMENSWRARPYTRFILIVILRDHSTLPSIYVWGFGSEPTCRCEILFLYFSIIFNIFYRF